MHLVWHCTHVNANEKSLLVQLMASCLTTPSHYLNHWWHRLYRHIASLGQDELNKQSPVTWSFEHDDVIKWKHFPRYWPFVREIHRSSVNSPHKGQWRGALMFSLICVWINGWVNSREAGVLRRYGAHYDVTVMEGVRLLSAITHNGNASLRPGFVVYPWTATHDIKEFHYAF